MAEYSPVQISSKQDEQVQGEGNCLDRIGIKSKGIMESFFFRWGYMVATHPKKFITLCFLLCFVCATGFVYFKEETRPDKLILPATSEYAVNIEWIRREVAVPIRENYAIINAQNVLTPQVMRILVDLHKVAKEGVRTSNGKTWEDVCFKAPITKFDLEDDEQLRRRRKRSVEESQEEDDAWDYDFFNDNSLESNFTNTRKYETYHNMPESLYCSIINSLDEACLEFNPVELWSYDKEAIYNLTQEEIIRVFNHELISPVFGRRAPYKIELGGNIEKNEKGEIISAESLLMKWVVRVDLSGEVVTDSQGVVGDANGIEWERGLITAFKKFATTLPEGIKFYFANASCFGDILDDTLMEEGLRMVFGFSIMFIYVGVMIGRFNFVEQRPLLTMAGLGSIVMAILVSVGICAHLGLPFMTLNRVLPFLMLGIGIDDMFVIIQCWNNLYPEPFKNKVKQIPIPERMGLSLKHAGLSIFLTSVTDIAAFMAGSLTAIPSLRSFCIYAVIGIAALFFFQCTFFVAYFAIDQKRLEERRNAYCHCVQYSEATFVPASSVKNSWTQSFFDNILSKYLLTKGAKVIVLLFTGVLLAIGLYGNAHLKQHSDALWFVPEDSYLVQFFRSHTRNYPTLGYPALVVAHEVNWTESLAQVGNFIEELDESPLVYDSMQFYTGFKTFVKEEYNIDVSTEHLDEKQFNKFMGRYLYSPYGAMYKYFFKFHGNFSCGDSLPPIETVIVPFRFKYFYNGAEEHIPAMNKIKASVHNTTNSIKFIDPVDQGRFLFWAQISIAWEVDEIIQAEMYKNLALSITCVLIISLFLLANFRMCLMCGICIIFTVIDVTGAMHFWGLTVDSVACTILVLAVGLCVDYAAHICLAFMGSKSPTKTERARDALSSMGPAVFHGGFSTFLGIVILIKAQTVAAFSFFKIFTLVVAFGLFHGLIFLPVLLSLFGPDLARKSPQDALIEEKRQKGQEMYALNGKQADVCKVLVEE